MKRLTVISILLAFGLAACLLAGCGEPDDAEASQTIENEEVIPRGSRVIEPVAAARGVPGSAEAGEGGGRRSRGGPAILTREDVQEELALTDDQIVHLEELTSGEGEPSEIEEHLADVLDLDQLVRYRELSLQREGVNGLVNDEVVATLGLSEDQISEITEAVVAARPQRSEGGFDREAFMKLREELDTKIDEILTDEQKSKWEELLGEEFEFARQQRGGGAGGAGDATPR